MNEQVFSSGNKSALIILGRFPHPGKVKTRLAKEIGEELAAKIYRGFIEHLLLEIDKLPKTTIKFFCYAVKEDKEDLKNWVGDKVTYLHFSEDVEENLKNAFGEIFEQGFKKVISIASDVPQISAKLVLEAFEKLESFDVVIGPDQSGGIYLYGEKKHLPQLFKGGSRVGSKIFEETIQKIRTMNLNYFVFPNLIDVDTLDDYKKYETMSLVQN